MKSLTIPNYVHVVRSFQFRGLATTPEELHKAVAQYNVTVDETKAAMLLELKSPAPVPALESQFLRMLQEAWDIVTYADNPFDKEKAVKLIERHQDNIVFP